MEIPVSQGVSGYSLREMGLGQNSRVCEHRRHGFAVRFLTVQGQSQPWAWAVPC